MIKLYQYEVCPFCCKVRSVLDFKKIPYETVEVNPLGKQEIAFSTDYKKVPILVDNGKVVTESNDIIRYLDENYPKNPVFSENSNDKIKQEEWLQYADSELVIILPPNIYGNFRESLSSFDYITNHTKFSKPKRVMIKFMGAFVMTMVAKKKMKEREITDPRKSLRKTLLKWEEALGSKDFMGGNKPDVSDLACMGILQSVHGLKIWDFIAEQKPIADWYQRVEKSLAA
jgi:microsomal prostaglandin-E synthase 2